VEMKNILRTSVAAGALFALAAPLAPSAHADFKNQNSKVNLTIGGQIVRSLIYADDGEHSQLFNVDGRTVGTRLRYIASGQLTESVKVGGMLEHDVGQSNDGYTFDYGITGDSSTYGTASTSGATGNDRSSDATGFGIRHAFVSFEHKSMGKLSLGQTNTASNGTMETSLMHSGNSTLAGATMLSKIRFTTGTNGAFSTVGAASSTDTLDGLSRDDVIRYDTPTFAGFSLATSMQDEGTYDAAARWSGKIAGLSAKASAHFANTEAGGSGTVGAAGKQRGIAGSVGHSSGFALRANYGHKRVENSGRKPKVWMVGGEYNAKLSSLGGTAFYVEHYRAEDIQNAGHEMKTLYVGIVQKMDSIGSEMSLVYGNHSLSDSAGTDYNDINSVMFQTMLNF
jgi:predicted porin